MKCILYLLFNLLLVFHYCFGELESKELQALNALSNAWNLGWDPYDTNCPGNRNIEKEYIICQLDKIISLYLLENLTHLY